MDVQDSSKQHDASSGYVLSVDFVSKAILELQKRKFHETVPLYLQLLRMTADTGIETGIAAEGVPKRIAEDWLAMPGGPVGKPNYRPFSTGSTYWMNANVAGSYALSSLRAEIKEAFQDPAEAHSYKLPDPTMVRDVLLQDAQAPAWAIAAYLYRDRLFTSPSGDIAAHDLVRVFARDMGLETRPNVQQLFDMSVGTWADSEVFDQWEDEAQ